MKKTYIAPAIKVVKLNTERMIAQSTLGTTGLGGFGGGGPCLRWFIGAPGLGLTTTGSLWSRWW